MILEVREPRVKNEKAIIDLGDIELVDIEGVDENDDDDDDDDDGDEGYKVINLPNKDGIVFDVFSSRNNVDRILSYSLLQKFIDERHPRNVGVDGRRLGRLPMNVSTGWHCLPGLACLCGNAHRQSLHASVLVYPFTSNSSNGSSWSMESWAFSSYQRYGSMSISVAR